MDQEAAETNEAPSADKPKHAGGRPTAFRESYIEQVYKLTLLGATDKQLADFFGVCEDTINEWKKVFPEFSESLKKGKMLADAEVAERLYHRAKGYSHPEEKIFCFEGNVIRAETTKHYPPDTGAAAFWLKNRQSLNWRESHDFTSGGEKIKPQIINFGEALKIVQASQAREQGGNEHTG